MTSLKTIVIIATTALVTACGGSGTSSNTNTPIDNSPSTGTISIAITDAPVDALEKVVVQFDGIEIKLANGNALTFEFAEPKTIDLLTLQGDNVEPLIEGEQVAAGEYNWIRLLVTANEDGKADYYVLETVGGEQQELTIPSGFESGLKLVSGFTVAQGGIHAFTIDFDLAKSIVKPAAANQPYKLKPALRLVDNNQVGSLSVTIDSTLLAEACSDTSLNAGAIYLWSGTDAMLDLLASGSETSTLVTTAAIDVETSMTHLGFIVAGEYTVGFTCDNERDSVDGIDTTGVDLQEGETAESLIQFYGTQNIVIEENQTTNIVIDQVTNAP